MVGNRRHNFQFRTLHGSGNSGQLFGDCYECRGHDEDGVCQRYRYGSAGGNHDQPNNRVFIDWSYAAVHSNSHWIDEYIGDLVREWRHCV